VHLDILNKNDARPSAGVSTIPPGTPWSYPIARVLVIALGWGFAWVVSQLIGLVAPGAATISFYVVGVVLTLQGLSALARHYRLQRRLRREANRDFGQIGEPESQVFPEGWSPTRRRAGYHVHGLSLIAIAIVFGYLAPSLDAIWGWVWLLVVAIIGAIGINSMLLAVFASDERILRSLKPGRPRSHRE
jgi:hypothetical protein